LTIVFGCALTIQQQVIVARKSSKRGKTMGFNEECYGCDKSMTVDQIQHELDENIRIAANCCDEISDKTFCLYHARSKNEQDQIKSDLYAKIYQLWRLGEIGRSLESQLSQLVD